MTKTKKALIEKALKAAQEKGIKIQPGPAAFHWIEGSPSSCSAFGALILHLNLRDLDKDPGPDMIARAGWWQEVCNYLGVNGWWLRRFYCGFELDRLVHTLTDKSKNYKFWTVNEKGRKLYYIEDSVSIAAKKMRKTYI